MPELQPVDDIEELADFYMHRPLARLVGTLLLPTAISPDQITLMSGATGVLAGMSLWLGADRPPLRLAAAVLLWWSVVLDCTDGYVARMRKQISRTGVILDGFVDAVVGLTVLLALTSVAARQYPGEWIWALGAVAILSSEAHCFLFDVAKEQYVTALGMPYAGSKLLLADHWREIERAAPGRRGRRLADALLLTVFAGYARVVRRLGGTSAAAVMRPLTRRQIRVWAFLGLGTHMACLYIAAAVSYFWPPALLACLILFSTAMNLLLFVLLRSGSERPTVRA
jgi:phosphatidylglycerophosphate synthase